jgi:hypothetical protein
MDSMAYKKLVTQKKDKEMQALNPINYCPGKQCFLKDFVNSTDIGNIIYFLI